MGYIQILCHIFNVIIYMMQVIFKSQKSIFRCFTTSFDYVQQNSTGYNKLKLVVTGFNSKQQISTVYNKFQLVATGLDCLQQVWTGCNKFGLYTTSFDCLQSFNCLQQVLIVYKFKLFTTSVDSLQVSIVDNKFRLLLNLLFFCKVICRSLFVLSPFFFWSLLCPSTTYRF